MYKSIKDYVNEANDEMNDVSKKVLKIINGFGFTFDPINTSALKAKFPCIVSKRGIDVICVNCSRKTKWYTISISCPFGDPAFTIKFNNDGAVNDFKVMNELKSDLRFTENVMSELARTDLNKLTKVEN